MDPVTIGFIVYLILVLSLGFYSLKLTRNMNDFALGGQRLGPWIIAFSERASGESAWLIIGLPGAALMAGLVELWTVVGCILGIIFSWFLIAKPLRIATGKFQVLTLPQLFTKRFKLINPLKKIKYYKIVCLLKKPYYTIRHSPL